MRKLDRSLPIFSLWRILLGLYLLVFTLLEFHYRAEFFGRNAFTPEAFGSENFFRIFFDRSGDLFADICFALRIIFCLSFMLGFYRRIAALGLYLTYLCLFDRYVGVRFAPEMNLIVWLLVMTIFIPEGEPLSFCRKKEQWRVPTPLLLAAWAVLDLAYLHSGLTKLYHIGLDQSWRDGTAMLFILGHPHALREWVSGLFIGLPHVFFQFLTYSVLFIELTPIFVLPFKKYRLVLGWAGLIMNVFILILLNLTQVSLGLILYHIFLFSE